MILTQPYKLPRLVCENYMMLIRRTCQTNCLQAPQSGHWPGPFTMPIPNSSNNPYIPESSLMKTILKLFLLYNLILLILNLLFWFPKPFQPPHSLLTGSCSILPNYPNHLIILMVSLYNSYTNFTVTIYPMNISLFSTFSNLNRHNQARHKLS